MPCEQSLLHEGAPDCPTESKPRAPALLAAAQPSPWLRPAKDAPNYHPTTTNNTAGDDENRTNKFRTSRREPAKEANKQNLKKGGQWGWKAHSKSSRTPGTKQSTEKKNKTTELVHLANLRSDAQGKRQPQQKQTKQGERNPAKRKKRNPNRTKRKPTSKKTRTRRTDNSSEWYLGASGESEIDPAGTPMFWAPGPLCLSS